MKTVTTEQLRQQLAAGPVALFDVRGDVEYEMGHIPGAKTAPLGSLIFRVADVMNPDSYVVVYSNGGECPFASEAAKRLEDLKLKNVYCYPDGLKGWRDADLPVIPSPNPKLYTQGPVEEVRHLNVDIDTAYGGAFKDKSYDTEGSAGG